MAWCLVLWYLLLLSHSGESTTEVSVAATTFKPTLPINCSDFSYLDTCVAMIQGLMEGDEEAAVRLPVNAAEIDEKCTIFTIGMNCFNAYITKCLTKTARATLENRIFGAKTIYSFLCKDGVFKKDYLRHRTCYRGIAQDWDNCIKRFNDVKNAVSNPKRKDLPFPIHMMDYCCANIGFTNCIYVNTRIKCDRDAANFLRRTAEVLLAMKSYTYNCNNIDLEMCSSAGDSFRLKMLYIKLILLCLFVWFLSRCKL